MHPKHTPFDSPDQSSTEEWRDVPSFEGLYRVSSLGRVYSISRTDRLGRNTGGLYLRPSESRRYSYVQLVKDGRATSKAVHRLVLLAFFPVETELLEANHKNGNTHDNRLINLEWVTKSGNLYHSYRVLGRKAPITRGENHHKTSLTDEDVRTMRALYKQGGWTHQELGTLFGISKCQAGKIIRREFWTHIE